MATAQTHSRRAAKRPRKGAAGKGKRRSRAASGANRNAIPNKVLLHAARTIVPPEISNEPSDMPFDTE
jgi:hypothetical protein